MRSRPSLRRPPRSYRRLFLISLTIWLIVVFSIVGISRWIKERTASPAPPEKGPASAESAAANPISESGAEEEAAPEEGEESARPISEEERRQAERVAEKFVRRIITMPEGDSPEAVAEAVKPYVSRSYYEAIRQSMKVGEPKKIRELTLWPVEPPLLEGGLSFEAVVMTSDNEELHLWFSMKKDENRWIVWQREEGFR
ncbi:MAG: hypothetical protein AB2404_00610 [Planifilum fimeticola]|jgi:hypothetical protein